MKQLGLPVIPGSDGPVRTNAEALRIAEAIGYPVMLKAKAGGGKDAQALRRTDGPALAGVQRPCTERRRGCMLRGLMRSEAIVDCALNGKTERYVPRYYWLAAAARILAPKLVSRATAGGAFTTSTGSNRPH